MNKVIVFSSSDSRWFSLEDYEGEIWEKVSKYEGLYSVSNYGRVKSLLRTSSNYGRVFPEKIKTYTDNGHGYLYVELCKNGKNKKHYVHRLVAAAFIPNPLNLPQINHRDENKKNNMLDNLEWCTQNYNNKYGTARFRLEKTRRNNGNTTKIDMYDLNGNLLKRYQCSNDIERDGISRRAAYLVCTNRARSYKGCVFRFHGQPFDYRETDRYPKGEKKKVIKTDTNGKVLHIFESIKEAERENGLSRNYLYSATYASTHKAYINGYYYEIKKYNPNKTE